jgi:hypothetical protein
MMAKAQEDRYQSYDELINHLRYAREKVIARAQENRRDTQKARVVIEDEKTRSTSGWIVMLLFVFLIAAGVVAYQYRSTFFPTIFPANSGSISSSDALENIAAAQQTLLAGRASNAARAFQGMASSPRFPQPERAWAEMNHVLAALLAGEGSAALQTAASLASAPDFSDKPRDQALIAFFRQAGTTLRKPGVITVADAAGFREGDQAMALLLFAVRNLAQATGEGNAAKKKEYQEAAMNILKMFQNCRPSSPWITAYAPLVESLKNGKPSVPALVIPATGAQ